MSEKEMLKTCLEALDFYSASERYQSKKKKEKPRIVQDSGKIARRTTQMLRESGVELEHLK
jgi:hypothetical protein